jgi:hypothetical protein
MGTLASKLNRTLTPVLLAAAFDPGAALNAANGQPGSRVNSATELGVAEFQQLKPILDIKNQPWTTIPWKYSITEARKLAAATNKPIFMVINTGNALGCT